MLLIKFLGLLDSEANLLFFLHLFEVICYLQCLLEGGVFLWGVVLSRLLYKIHRHCLLIHFIVPFNHQLLESNEVVHS